MSTVPAQISNGDRHGREPSEPVDVHTIRKTVAAAMAPHIGVPEQSVIDILTQRLIGQAGMLLLEDLGEDDDELHDMRGEAEMLLRSQPDPTMTRSDCWQHAQILAASTKGLLRRYQMARAS